MTSCQHGTVEVGKDAVVALQPAGFELQSVFHSGHILHRSGGDIFDTEEGILCQWCIHIFPPIEYATLAGNTAERCAIPMDRQLRLVQRLGFKPSTVQGNADFLEVAELLLLVVVIHSKNSFP